MSQKNKDFCPSESDVQIGSIILSCRLEMKKEILMEYANLFVVTVLVLVYMNWFIKTTRYY